ncbi:MAG: DNA-directed RNA polymerase subunit N [Candidatus Diapherotrites archaeon]|nr:DNA-directed RNA polymerase subunit N [Candidatus Diapherotrites archaeon]
MMVPIRCFSCGKQLAGLYEQFKQRVEKGEKAEKVMDDLGVRRYCCRRMLLSHTDLIDDIMRYKS